MLRAQLFNFSNSDPMSVVFWSSELNDLLILMICRFKMNDWSIIGATFILDDLVQSQQRRPHACGELEESRSSCQSWRTRHWCSQVLPDDDVFGDDDVAVDVVDNDYDDVLMLLVMIMMTDSTKMLLKQPKWQKVKKESRRSLRAIKMAKQIILSLIIKIFSWVSAILVVFRSN